MPESTPETPIADAPELPHLCAAGLALALVAVGLWLALPVLERWVRPAEDALITKPLPQRDQGLLLQDAMLRQSDVLPIYGSSELIIEKPYGPYRASEFFRDKPTGFLVSPVGKPGNTTLLMAQKFAAAGELLRGKKLAIILSYTWFHRAEALPDQYAGNFSPIQACGVALSSDLDPKLLQRFSQRMLDYPGSLESEPILNAYLDTLAHPTPLNLRARAALRPFLKCNMGILHWYDRWGAVLSLLGGADSAAKRGAKELAHPPGPPVWDSLIAPAEKELPATKPEDYDNPAPGGEFAQELIAQIDPSREWTDFTIMLDTLVQLGAKPLVISIPMDGTFYDKHKVGRSTRDHYYMRLREICEKRGVPVEEFLDHDRDPGFIVGSTSHPTKKGWLYINKVLDEFFHDRYQPSADAKP